MKTKDIVVTVAKYAVGLGLLAFTVSRNWEPKGKSPGISGLLGQTPDFAVLLGCAGLYVFVIGFQFVRWYLLVRAVDLPFTKRDAFRLGLVGLFYNSFLPGAIGGDIVKAYYIAKDRPGRRPAAVATVAVDRLLGLFGLMLLAAVVGGGAWLAGDASVVGNKYLETIIVVTGSGVAVMAGGWALLGILPAANADAFAVKLQRVPKIGRTFADLWAAGRLFRSRPGVIYLSVLLSAGSHLSMVALFHLAVRVFAMPGPGDWLEHAVITPIGYIAQVFFPVPGGVGGAEAIFGYLYTLVGRDEATGVVGRLTLRVFEWTIGLVGYAVFLRMKVELPAAEVGPDAEAKSFDGV